MGNIAGGGHGTLVRGDGLRGVEEGTIGREGEARLPEMEAGGAVGGDAGGEGELFGGEFCGVGVGGGDGEVD